MTPRWPKSAPRGPKIAPRWPKTPEDRAPGRPPGATWAYVKPLSQPSRHPTSLLDAFMADTSAPKPHFASFAKPSTCTKHRCLWGFSEVRYLPSAPHVPLNLNLQNPKIQPESCPRHPKIGLQDGNFSRWFRDGPAFLGVETFQMGQDGSKMA